MIIIDIIIKDSWNIILHKDRRLLDDSLLPLVNIENYLDYYNLYPLPSKNFEIIIDPTIRSKKPSFKNVSDEIILSLRHNIYSQTDMDLVKIWSEKLMLFCEVRLFQIKKRSLNKWKDKNTAQLGFLHLATFLIDHAILTKDIRLLNTVLKLADIKWIIDRKIIKNKLEGENKNIISALFQFRILLMTEYAIKHLI